MYAGKSSFRLGGNFCAVFGGNEKLNGKQIKNENKNGGF